MHGILVVVGLVSPSLVNAEESSPSQHSNDPVEVIYMPLVMLSDVVLVDDLATKDRAIYYFRDVQGRCMYSGRLHASEQEHPLATVVPSLKTDMLFYSAMGRSWIRVENRACPSSDSMRMTNTKVSMDVPLSGAIKGRTGYAYIVESTM